jgi:hypothetical protein
VEGRIFLTSGRAAEMRKEGLENFAKDLAEKVLRTGRSITVSSKTSQERRVIHLTLDGMPGISTRSVGSGDRRRLIVFPTDARRQRSPENQGENRVRNAETAGEGQARAQRPEGDKRRRNKRRGRGGGRRDQVGENGVAAMPTNTAPEGAENS